MRKTSYQAWLRANVRPLTGERVLITGGNSGIGFECARHLLSLGARVTLCCRSPERGRAAAEALQAAFPEGQVGTEQLDLASFSSIDAFVQKHRQRGEKIHILLHCAGVYYPREAVTADGLPTTVGVNYVGTVRLTEGLLPLLPPDGRVIFTTSLVDRFGRVRPDAPTPRSKEGYADYAESKLLLSAAKRGMRTMRKASCFFPPMH